MKRFLGPAFILLIFAGSVFFVANSSWFRFFIPARQVVLSHGVQYGAVLKDFLFEQEITLDKRYLSRVDVYMAKLPATYPNENVFLLADSSRRILFTKRFSSEDFGEALYFPFDLGKQFDLGRGSKVYACIYSIDGDQGSYIGLARKEGSTLGRLGVVSIVGGDVPASLQRQESRVDFTGSIGVRTFGSDTRYFGFLQVAGYLAALFIALLLWFRSRVAVLAGKVRMSPAAIFPWFSVAAGMVFLVLTPPFMVPDEPVHFYRAWQISEGNIFKMKDDFPKALTELSGICNRMQFSTHEKTSRKEILSLASIRTDPAQRAYTGTPDYTLPYLPQALGIMAGKLFGLAPLWSFYLGRLFNLLVSVLLIWWAIRITPVYKWVFFLLGVMPMTLYQMASHSYDPVTTGLCFVMLALVLQFATRTDREVQGRELLVLAGITALLALAKQPYLVTLLTFFIIPPARFGTRKKYLLTAGGLLLIAATVSVAHVPARAVARMLAGLPTPAVMPRAFHAAAGEGFPERYLAPGQVRLTLAMLPHAPEGFHGAQEGETAAQAASQAADQPQPADAAPVGTQPPVNPIQPEMQKKFILDDPARYTGILLSTLKASAGLYLTSFVGLFGWIDTPLPVSVSYLYLVVLLLASLFGIGAGRCIGLPGKLILAAVFITGFVLVETALYVYCNPVGSDPIIAVQGRYFIALGPLVFLLLANRFLPSRAAVSSAPAQVRTSGKKSTQAAGRQTASPFLSSLSRSIPWISMAAAIMAFAWSVAAILERFYVITS